MVKFFFTSDHHFFHKNIIDYCNRPYNSLSEMHEDYIEKWNSVVCPGDCVYHLGDFAFTGSRKMLPEVNRIIDQLNGQIHLILGNHDRRAVKDANFAWVGHYKSIRIQSQRIVLFHYPILSWHGIHQGAWHFHGHCHGNLRCNYGKMIDVGVDCTAGYPCSFEHMTGVMENLEERYVDHHAPSSGER